MASVADVMTPEVATIGPDAAVGRATELMENLRIGGLPVVEGGLLIGILTSRDVRRTHPNRLVADAMSCQVVTVPPETSLWEARDLLIRHGIERLVVVREGCPVGVVTKERVNAELNKYVDALTGLNGAAFLRRQAMHLLESGMEVTVIFMDLDNFGLIDKEIGHVRGDEILQQAARVLRAVVEDGVDQLCRYAGDEFAVVTVRPLEEAQRLAASMVSALAGTDWPHGLRVTASAGLAGGRRSNPREDQDPTMAVSNLINMASLACTAAKRGRGPVLVADQIALQEAT